MPNKTPAKISMENIGNPCASSSAIGVKAANYVASKKGRDRQNIDCVVPALSATIGVIEEAGLSKKETEPMCSRSAAHTSETMSIMYGTSKSKKHYGNLINRKKQNQILNSLKSWNVKIAPSGLDKPDVEFSVGISSSIVREKSSHVLGRTTNNQNYKALINGVALRNEQDCRTHETEIHSAPQKKPSQEVKHNKSKREISEKKFTNNAYDEEVANEKKHLEGHTAPTAKGFISGDNDRRHIHPVHIMTDLSPKCPIISPLVTPDNARNTEISSASSAKGHFAPFSLRGNHQKNSNSNGRTFSTSNWGWNQQRQSNGDQSKEFSGSSRIASGTGQINLKDGVQGFGNGKLKESPDRLGHHSPSSQSYSSCGSLTIHPNQQHSQQQPSYMHHFGQQHHHQHGLDVHHSAQQNSSGGLQQYSFDFLRDVAQKTSLVGGGAPCSSSVNSMFRSSTQMNYNIPSQYQQQMMQHYQNTHLHHQQNSSPGQASHVQLNQHAPHQQQQHLHYIHRSQSTYGTEDMSPQGGGGVAGELKSYSNYDVLSAGDLQNTNSGSQSYEFPSYAYSQNGNVQQQQQQQQQQNHHQGIQYQSHMPQSNNQQHQLHMNNYHQNNNYQYHNRNVMRGNQLNYLVHGGGGGSAYREDGGRNGKKSAWNGKGKGIVVHANGGKHFNKVQNIGHGYRKNSQNYHGHSVAGGQSQYYDHMAMSQHQQQLIYQQHHKQQHLHRNLVYVRGYDRGHGAVYHPHEYNGVPDVGDSIPREQADTGSSSNQSLPSCPKSKSPALETETRGAIGQQNEPVATVDTSIATEEEPNRVEVVEGDEASTEKLETAQLRDEDELELKDHCNVPRSSSSSSMVSIPSTESSAISSMMSQTQLLECTQASGNEYDSDSSHSSDFRDATYRYATFGQMNSGEVYRSSSSTSGISSSATNQHSNEFIPSAPSSLHASTVGLSELIIRSHSYHGSHQNLTTFGSVGSGGEASSPVGSPTGTLRPVSGTQSVPILGELFANSNHNHNQRHQIQFTGTHSSASRFGSSASLELALRSSSSSLPVSSVPPNDFLSMQSGHPKKRCQSGRTSPVVSNEQYRPNVCFSGNNKGQPSLSSNSSGRKNNQVSLSYVHRTSLPTDFQYTPADRFILRANDIELKTPPDSLSNGTVWDGLSEAIWEKFCVAQQTADKYLQKMQLWRDLYISIKQGFPKYGLYLVGSTISGFGADSSDVDMCLVSRTGPGYFDPRNEALQHLKLVKNYFVSMAGSSFDQFCLIQAKVPILRFQDSKNGIEVDLNFNNCVGIRNTHLLHCYSQMDWRVRPLVLVVKLWAQHHNINDAKNMTISSYSLVLMVIHFLQCGVNPSVLPCLHSMYPEKFMKIIDINSIEMIERVEPYQTENQETLGELLLHFLKYYKEFDYAHYAISVRTASIIPIEECRLAKSYKNDLHQWKHLCIEEPFDLTNTARSVFDGEVFEHIKSTIATSWRMLKDSKDLSSLFCEPLFTPLTSTLSITS